MPVLFLNLSEGGRLAALLANSQGCGSCYMLLLQCVVVFRAAVLHAWVWAWVVLHLLLSAVHDISRALVCCTCNSCR
jgi:hypothetical protein